MELESIYSPPGKGIFVKKGGIPSSISKIWVRKLLERAFQKQEAA